MHSSKSSQRCHNQNDLLYIFLFYSNEISNISRPDSKHSVLEAFLIYSWRVCRSWMRGSQIIPRPSRFVGEMYGSQGVKSFFFRPISKRDSLRTINYKVWICPLTGLQLLTTIIALDDTSAVWYHDFVCTNL